MLNLKLISKKINQIEQELEMAYLAIKCGNEVDEFDIDNPEDCQRYISQLHETRNQWIEIQLVCSQYNAGESKNATHAAKP